MLIIWCGNRGSGKTYKLVEHACKALALGRNIYCNFSMQLPHNARGSCFRFSTLRDLTHVRDANIYIDEIQSFMNSRQWKSMPAEFYYSICESRKSNTNWYGTVQRLQRIDIAYREQVDQVLVCRRFFTVNSKGMPSKWWPLKNILPIHITSWHQPGVDPNGETVWKEWGFNFIRTITGWSLLNPKIARLYNTYESTIYKERLPLPLPPSPNYAQ